MSRVSFASHPFLLGFEDLDRLVERSAKCAGDAYPPYNIEKVGDDAFRIEVAVAGFAESELEIEAKENVLTVSGAKAPVEDDARTFLHRGIAERNFVRRFQLADYVIVRGAALENGLLSIELVRELPEAMKPRKIDISSSTSPAIEGKKTN